MKICTFCGYQTDNSTKICTSCGSKQFSFICPNCSNEFKGKFCPACGTRNDAVAKICPDCGRKYFSKSCPDCGYNESRKTQTRVSTAPVTARTTGTVFSEETKKARSAFVMSLVGFITFIFPLLIIGFIMGLKGSKNKELDEQTKRYYSLALALGAVGLILSIAMGLVYIVGIVGVALSR